MKRTRNLFASILGVLILPLVLVSLPAVASAQVAVRAAAGGVGGGWYTTLAGLAEIVASKYPEINMQVVPGAGLSNPPRVGEKGIEISFSFPPFTYAAYMGTEPFPKKYDRLRSIAKGFGSTAIQVVIDADFGIMTFDQLMASKKPLRIVVERNGTTDEWIFRKMLEFYKIDYKTIASWGGKVIHAGYGDQTVLMKDRQVDVMVGNVSAPWTAVMEASMGRKVRLLPLSDALIKYLQEKYALIPFTIKADAYSFMDKPISTVACVTQLICHQDVPEEVIYKITKALCENPEKVHAVHDAAKMFDPATAWSDNGAPLHPGAERYYREAGYIH